MRLLTTASLVVALLLGPLAPAVLATRGGHLSGRVQRQRAASATVVFLEGLRQMGTLPPPPRMLQKGMRFQPEVLVIGSGRAVEFPNDDHITHNVFSVSRARTFDLGLYRAGVLRTVRFDRPGLVDVFCSIHENMHAKVVVVPSDYFALVRGGGTFDLQDVPAGTHRLVVWVGAREVARTSVTITAGQTTEVSVRIP